MFIRPVWQHELEVVLYARSDDGSGLRPMFIRQLESIESISVDGQMVMNNVVRLELATEPGKVLMCAVGVEVLGTADSVAYVTAIYNYVASGCVPKDDLESIERTAIETIRRTSR
jgi:hypothetical protein